MRFVATGMLISSSGGQASSDANCNSARRCATYGGYTPNNSSPCLRRNTSTYTTGKE